MDITYTKRGDYYYPDLALPPQPKGDIGRFGRMRKRFLKQHRHAEFNILVAENRLNEHIAEINAQALEQIDLITSQLAQAEGVTEDLKARDQFEWIRAINSCRARAEERVIRELVLAQTTGAVLSSAAPESGTPSAAAKRALASTSVR